MRVAQRDSVTRHQDRLRHPRTIDERAVGRSYVSDQQQAIELFDSAVTPADFGVGQADIRLRAATDDGRQSVDQEAETG